MNVFISAEHAFDSQDFEYHYSYNFDDFLRTFLSQPVKILYNYVHVVKKHSKMHSLLITKLFDLNQKLELSLNICRPGQWLTQT